MSLYGANITIDGIVCGMVMRGSKNGQYRAVFEREYATLEQIEAINWAQPTIVGETILPTGYGYTVADIQYSMSSDSYTVILQVGDQYLGDVAGYQSQVAELQSTVAQQSADIQTKEATIESQAQTIQELEAAGSAAELKEDLTEAYQEGVESNG